MPKIPKFKPYVIPNLFRSRSLSSILEIGESEDMNNELGQQAATSAEAAANLVMTHNDVFQSLRIPDAIKQLPTFDGNPRLLFEFLSNVEEILLFIRGTDKTPYGSILLRAIRNKIEGQANEVLNMYGTPLNWDNIRDNLILHYADKRTETSLIRDLHGLKQYRKPFEKFYSEVVEIQSALCNNILLNENDQNVVKAKKELYGEMCLNSFVTGLMDPLGVTIRAMRPRSLAEALDFCVKEQNIYYQRGSFNRYPVRGQIPQRYSYERKPYSQSSRPYYSNPQNGYTYNNPPRFTQNTTFNNFRRNDNDNNLGTDRETPYRYRTNNTNNNYMGINRSQNQLTYNNNNNSTYNTIPKLQPPEPMDTSSGFSSLNKNFQGNFKQSPSTRMSRRPNMEMNNVQEEEESQFELTNIEENTNFRTGASFTRRDT